MVFFSGSMHKNLEQTCKGDKRLTAEFPALLFKITCHFSPCFRTFLKFTSFSNSIVGKIKAFKRQSFSTFIHEMKGNCNKLKYWKCRKLISRYSEIRGFFPFKKGKGRQARSNIHRWLILNGFLMSVVVQKKIIKQQQRATNEEKLVNDPLHWKPSLQACFGVVVLEIEKLTLSNICVPVGKCR